ncbi:hypothetical protein KPH14_002380 [Odynerus spinipes]|uniref:Uncharacterized protein n=1 Tax=Odynerus spinipes TaxID=1348599 RepID=A0AAD9VQ27_9HYME|nr:hypothetical protein KPH14_002380 [Odynerus spinipes]
MIVVLAAGRLRERQYQLAAQKRNEASQKQDYYQQTARYFERQTELAKQYDSWNEKLTDRGGQLEKTRKAERLIIRRNKLRNLLKKEEETYRREIEELEARKKRRDNASLEVLREKLKERRLEQDLYLPSTCRRVRSYFLDPKRPGSSNSASGSILSSNLSECLYLKDSTNFQRGKGAEDTKSDRRKGAWRTRTSDPTKVSMRFSTEIKPVN